jgi:hypothetical protein
MLNVPRNLPSNFTLIVTSKSDSIQFKNIVLQNETWYKMKLGYMNELQSKKFVESYLNKYNKVNTLKMLKIFYLKIKIKVYLLEIR